MPRVLFPNVPMRMVLQPRNKLAQNLRGAGARTDPTASNHDARREGAWSKVVVHAPPSTNKFEIKQYLSKIYNLDVKKVRQHDQPPHIFPSAFAFTQPARLTAVHQHRTVVVPPGARLQVNTLNVEGRTVQRINGRKMFKTKKFPDYKKAYVKVGSSPADVDSNELGDDEWQGFVIPARTDGGVGVQALPRPEKYKMNQQTHWLNRLPLAEDGDEDSTDFDAVVTGAATEFQPNRRERGRFGTGSRCLLALLCFASCSARPHVYNGHDLTCFGVAVVHLAFSGDPQLVAERRAAARVARERLAEDIGDWLVAACNETWWSVRKLRWVSSIYALLRDPQAGSVRSCQSRRCKAQQIDRDLCPTSTEYQRDERQSLV